MTPRISVIIVSYDMAREIPRTVQSFLPPYQRGLSPGDVEVLVMENGSRKPVPDEIRRSWPSHVRCIDVPNAPPSPAHALNLGARMARAEWLCPVIDGARMASPGLLSQALIIAEKWPDAFIATLGMHLGRQLQQLAVLDGYNQAVEDELLAGIGWPADGYRLFEIAALAGSGQGAWFGPLSESNAPVLSAALYRALNGYDTAFDIPGGGIVNLDFFRRAVMRRDAQNFLLLGEATFHQFHGGVTTSRSVSEVEADGRTTWERYVADYAMIRGEAYSFPDAVLQLYGHLPNASLGLAQTAIANLRRILGQGVG